MAATKELIKRIRLTASAASIEFYNIPQDFDGLEIQVSVRCDRTTNFQGLFATFNSDSGTNYSYRRLTGEGASANSSSASGATHMLFGVQNSDYTTANTFSSHLITIPNYTSSTAKSISIDSVSEQNATAIYMENIAGLWAGTSAITSIKLDADTGYSLKSGSSFALYGWKKGSDGITSVG